MELVQPTLSLFSEQPLPTEGEWKVPTELPDLSLIDRLALDCETKGKNPFKSKPIGISVAFWADKLRKYYFPFGHSSGNMDEDLIRRWAIGNLRGKRIVGAHTKFDVHVLKNWGLDLESLGVDIGDVAFNGALLDDSRYVNLDLDSLGERYTGKGKLKINLDMNNLDQYPSWMVGPYAERDAETTLETDDATTQLLKVEGLEKVRELEDSIIYAVCEIERNGCRINVEKLLLWRKEIRRLFENTIWELYNLTGLKVEVGSPDSINQLFKQLSLQPPVAQAKKGRKQTKGTGKRVYTEEELLGMNHPVIKKVVEARWYASLLSKFLDKYSESIEGDLLRSKFHQLKTDDEDDEAGVQRGAISGRFSSAGGKDPLSGYSFNAQQVIKPKKQRDTLGDHHILREIFIPDDGMEYFSADLSQIEYRIAAHYANATKIIEAYQDPSSDFHAITQGWIQSYKPTHDDRTITKNVNFAYVFGSGEDTLAATAGISKKEAGELLGIMRRNAPEFPTLLSNLANEAERNGFVRTLWGRKARFGEHEKRYYAALNRVVQGSAADIFKVYLKAVYDNRKEIGIHKLRQVVHDELDGDLLPGYKGKLQEFLNEQQVQLKVPILWELSTGANWKDCK